MTSSVSMLGSASSGSVLSPSFPSSSSQNSSSESIPTTLNFPSEVLGIIGSFVPETLKEILPEKPEIPSDGPVTDAMRAKQHVWQRFSDMRKHPDSSGLVNDLMIAKQNEWQAFADYLRGHPDSFSGRIFDRLSDHGKKESSSDLVKMTFTEAKTRMNSNLSAFFRIQGEDPENLEIEDFDFERIDQMATEYLSISEKFIIEMIKEDRPQLPASNQQNPKVMDYLQQLEKERLLTPEIFEEVMILAANLGHFECLRTIVESKRFADISQENLGMVLQLAATNGYLDCLNAVIHSNRFADISREDLRLALLFAAQNGHPNCLNAIICSNRSSEIPENLR